ncbi:MAG: hypothetical protein H7833_14400 [Magnetococcus sp. DMHC-1]|nr:hypothetical protein [Magnetococcales bacterium]
MGIFSLLKRMAGSGNDKNNGIDREKERCLIKIQIRKGEFIILSKYYYQGLTSYKSYLNYLALNREKVSEVMEKANEKSSSGCILDDTYVIFYYDDTHFLLMPFEVFSGTEDMKLSLRNAKIWNRDNIIRILKFYPEFKEYDASMLTEMY